MEKCSKIPDINNKTKNMKKHTLNTLFAASTAALLAFNLQCCTKEPEDDLGGGGNGAYTKSDDISPSNLVAKFSFEDAITDAKGNISGESSNSITYGTGIKGKAYQGDIAGYALYSNISPAISGLQSFTVATWVKTTNHTDGAESWFQVLNDSNWIGNLFVIQESGAEGNDSVRIKLTFNKWDAPSWKEQWVDMNGNNRLIIGNNEWQHFTATYDAISSKFLVYINGKLQAMTDDVSNRFGDDPANGGGPLGPLKFKGATRFVFGCYNNHLPGNTPDPWMKHFDGGLDEFRIYNKALSSSDVESLHDLEKQGK